LQIRQRQRIVKASWFHVRSIEKHRSFCAEKSRTTLSVDVDQEQLDDDFRLVDLPFRFPHYLEFKDKVFVSANGTSTDFVDLKSRLSMFDVLGFQDLTIEEMAA